MAKSKKLVPPEMHCFLSCEAVSSDSSGKRSIHGMFDQIKMAEFPGLFKPFSLFIRLKGGSGKGVLTVRATGIDGKAVGEHSPFKGSFKKNTGSEIIVQIGAMPLPKPGEVTFELLLDNKKIGWPCKITVTKVDEV